MLLFNIEEDPGEESNVAESYAEVHVSQHPNSLKIYQTVTNQRCSKQHRHKSYSKISNNIHNDCD